MPPAGESASQPRTSFVSGLAWTFIACAALGALLVGAQLVAVSTVFPAEEMREVLREIGKSQPLPAFVDAAFEHLRALLAALLALCVVTLIASLGLLARRDWARVAFIWLSIAAAIVHAAGALAPLPLGFGPMPFAQEVPAELRGGFEAIMRTLLWTSIGSALAFAGAFAWLAKRLAAEDIRREFSAG
jgi:hypothetical protein